MVVTIPTATSMQLSPTAPEAIHLDPQNVEAYILRGIIHWKWHDREKALADYSAAIRIDPEHAGAYYNRGNSYLSMGRLDRAIADLTRDRSSCTHDIPRHFGCGRPRTIGKANWMTPLTIALKRSASIQLIPTRGFNRGLLYSKMGESDKAIADYTEVIRLKPDDAEAYYNPAASPAERKVITTLRFTDFTSSIQINPKAGISFHAQGVAYWNKGDKAKAEADFAQADKLGYKPNANTEL